MPPMLVLETPEDVARAAADELLAVARGGDSVHVALAGGHTPKRMFELLAVQDTLDWAKVHLYWGDERVVPTNDPQSNYHLARETLLSKVPVPDANVHPVPTHLGAEQAALAYEQILPSSRFDLIYLGLGPDGHIASLFPGTAALHETARRVVPNTSPKVPRERITFTFPVLNDARNVVVAATGDFRSVPTRCRHR